MAGRPTNRSNAVERLTCGSLKTASWLPNYLIQFRIKRRGDLAKALTNLCARPCGETKCECGRRLYFHKTRRQWRRPDTDVSAHARDQRHVFFLSHPGDEVQSSFGDFEDEVLA